MFAAQLGTRTTYQRDLERVGREHFGAAWGGVHSRDTVPRIQDKGTKVYVLNTDTAAPPPVGKGGVHWLAAMDHDGSRYMNDPLGSAGAQQRRHLVALHPGAQWADMDAEQRVDERDCGVRSLVALHIGLHCGIDEFLAL